MTSELSFIVYSMVVQAAGGRLIEARMHREGNIFDLDAMLAAIDANTRIVFLANPNNPTGTMLESDVVERFVAQVPADVIVVLDEAYYEYARHFAELRRVSYSNSLDYVRRGARVVVLRTFSKAYGLAGLRVGYGLGPAELLGYCARMRNTYSVSSVAEAGALAALDDANYVQRVVENNTAQSRVLTEGLMALGYGVAPTSANFVFCDLGEDAADVLQSIARGRRGGASDGSVGRTELRSGDDWDSGAESGVFAGGQEGGSAGLWRFRRRRVCPRGLAAPPGAKARVFMGSRRHD